MADGLTVAGISGAVAQTHVVVTAGFAEIAAGSIAMGLGGYLAAKSDLEHFQSEQKREEEEIKEKPQAEAEEIIDLFQAYELTAEEIGPLVEGLKRRPTAWRDFMMKFGSGRARSVACFQKCNHHCRSLRRGRLIPLLPYVLISEPAEAPARCRVLLVPTPDLLTLSLVAHR